MDREELKNVMTKWAAKCGSPLMDVGVVSHQGDAADFSFRWNKDLPILGEEGWEILEDGNELRAYASCDEGELFFEYDLEEAEGYEVVLSVEDASEVDQALELFWNADETLLSDPLPEALQGSHLAELRKWFEESYSDSDLEGEVAECGCERECDCDSDGCEDPRLVTITCDATTNPVLHCPVCGNAVEGTEFCPHVLFVNRNYEELIYMQPRFREELQEREIELADFTTDLQSLRREDFWDENYLFLDVFVFNGESGKDWIVGFQCSWK